MEGYLEIFGRKFCEKEISGYGEGNYLLRSENTESLFQSSPESPVHVTICQNYLCKFTLTF